MRLKSKIGLVYRYSWFKLLLWPAGILGFATLTILDFLPLLAEYRDNNVATQVNVMKNQTTHKPNISVCMPYHSRALTTVTQWIRNRSQPCPMECEGLKNHSWDIWNDIADGFPSENGLAMAIVNRLISRPEVFDSALTVNRSNFNWNEAILDAVWRFLACVSRQDMNLVHGSMNNFIADLCADFDLSKILWAPRDVVDKMFQYLIDCVGLYLKVTIAGTKTSKDSLDNRKRLFSIKGDTFCIGVHSTSTQDMFTFTPIPADQIPPPWVRAPTSYFVSVFYERMVLYSFVQSHQHIYPTEWQVPSTETISDDVALAYSIDARVLETRKSTKCDLDSTSDVICLVRHQALHAIEHCGCVPFMYRYLHDGYDHLEYCNHTLYGACAHEAHARYDHYQQLCRNKCEYIRYKWKLFSRTAPAEGWQWFFRMNMSALTEPFVEFRITIKDTPERFLAQVGGIVNLYLGCSGITLCGFVIVCIEFLRRYYLSRKNLVSRANDGGESASTIFMTESHNFGWKGGSPGSCVVTMAQLKEANEKLKQELIGMIRESQATPASQGGRWRFY